MSLDQLLAALKKVDNKEKTLKDLDTQIAENDSAWARHTGRKSEMTRAEYKRQAAIFSGKAKELNAARRVLAAAMGRKSRTIVPSAIKTPVRPSTPPTKPADAAE